VTVSYDDGLRSASIQTYSDVPWPKGKRVWLERWDGTVVSVSDRATERRYRSDENWPTRWGGFTFWFPLVCTLLFAALFVFLLRAFIRQLRAEAT
jgi:disulfide bond formation protein DsbB